MKKHSNGRGPTLLPDDRDLVIPHIDTAIAEADLWHGAESVKAAQVAYVAVEKLAAAGEDWAERIVKACAIEGFRLLVINRQSEDRGTIRLSHNGIIISMPTRVGVQRKATRRAGSKRYQRPLWWDLEWDEFDTYLRSREIARDLDSQEIAALREVQRLHALHPNAKTVAEACAAAGTSPRAFVI